MVSEDVPGAYPPSFDNSSALVEQMRSLFCLPVLAGFARELGSNVHLLLCVKDLDLSPLVSLTPQHDLPGNIVPFFYK